MIAGYDPEKTKGDCRLDKDAGRDAVGFFEEVLHHTKGKWAGQRFELVEWERDIIHNLFGWKQPNGKRRYRLAYIEVPRKNGKTTLLAGIALVMFYMDNEPEAEIYSVASDIEQASLVFNAAASMVRRSKHMSERVKIGDAIKRITYVEQGSFYKAIASNVAGAHGYNAHAVMFDELHTQPNRHLWDVMQTSTGAREQPLTVAITTAGWDRHSVCYEQHDYAEKVRDGIIEDPSFMPVIYGADDEDDWTDPETWKKANPNLGVSISLDYLERECKRAQEIPAYENTFRRLHLNQWTEQDVRWLPMDKWDACDGKTIDMTGRICWAGLDLSTTTDISAFVLVSLNVDDGSYDVKPYFWVPAEKARQRELNDRVPYPLWIRQGHIEATPGNVVDYNVIRQRINEIGETVQIDGIAIDRWNSTQLQQLLMEDGFEIEQFGQGMKSMTAPTKELEKLVVSEMIHLDGNPVMRWMASNVTVDMDAAGNIKPAKNRSTEKIDGIVGLIMGLGMAIRAGEPFTGDLLVY